MADSSTPRPLRKATRSIVVKAPLSAAYKQWVDLESFPDFLEPVSSVAVTSETYSHWVLSVGRITREFDAEILEQIPDDHLSWRTIGGDLAFTGRADFAAVDDDSTRVTLSVSWEPHTAAERAAATVGIDARVIASALRSYAKHLVSTGGPKGRSHVTIKSVDRDDPPPANAERV
ncbi:SRPBCC family protein [Herbiconiux flava]|uniref:Putative membrane protein n=1 Tax=Herbiconiux flava TaxID=881268 RepID=A0A852SS14_9MICO|nr:SRPBCC family protein [Herbiconiux flava]NYD71758.1 putative membrane protein [Herbiconiux flava]GLK18278.1 cyclase [Herbiconiux flava]